MIALDQRGADEDHDGAQHDGTQDSDHQGALLQFRTHAKSREDQQEYENVVYRERLLDDIAGEELQRGLVGDLLAHVPAQPVPESQVEQHGQSDPGDAPERCFLERNLVRSTGAQHGKIDDQGDDDQ